MARARLYFDAQKAYSSALSYLVPSAGTMVTVYEPDGTTVFDQVMYDAATGGNILSNPFSLSNTGTKVVYCDVPAPCILQPTGGAQVPARFERTAQDGGLIFDIGEFKASPNATASYNTGAIRDAIDALNSSTSGGILAAPAGVFPIVGGVSDTEIFLLGTKAFQVRGAGRYATRFVVQSSTPSTCDIFRVHITPTLPGCGMSDFLVMSQDGLGISNTYGRHTVNLDITESDREIREFEIARVWLDHFGSGSGGRCIELTNPTAHVNSFYLSTIRDSRIRGGIRLLNCGDTLTLERLALYGPNPGVEALQVAGATSLRLIGLNVTNQGGGVWLKAGIAPEILGGIYEPDPSYSALSGGSGNAAYIDLDGAVSTPIDGGTIKHATIAVPNHANPTDCIRLNYAKNIKIDDCYFNTATGRVGIAVTGNATTPQIGTNNKDVGAGTLIPGASFYPRNTTAIASAGTIAPPVGGGHIFSVSGTTQINTITARGDGDWLLLLPTGAWNFGSGGNIQPINNSAMSVVGPTWLFYVGGGTAKWFEMARR